MRNKVRKKRALFNQCSLFLDKDMGHIETETVNKSLMKTKEKKMKRFLNRKNRRFISLLSVMILSLSMGMTAFAAETDSNPEMYVAQVSESTPLAPKTNETPTPAEVTSTRSASGYAADYTDYSLDSFDIVVSGSSAVGSAKITAWDFPAGTKVYVSLQRPNGSFVFTDLPVTTGNSISRTVVNLQPGTYTLHYDVNGAGKGWINCNLS